MKTLKTLVAPWLELPDEQDCNLSGMSLDSRHLKKGELFFACSDQPDFLVQAEQRGAAAVLSAFPLSGYTRLPHCYLPELNQHLGELAARFYDYPSSKLKIIGVTGTNGKTSCTHFIAQALSLLGKPCGLIGTIGNGRFGQLQPATHTTPDSLSLQALLADFVQQGLTYVALETSSHGLSQNRLQSTVLETGILTNITQDHLDYHGTLEAYAAAKYKLFEQANLGILNGDDSYGLRWLQQLKPKTPVYAYSTQPDLGFSATNSLTTQALTLSSTGISAQLTTPWGEGKLSSPLLGRFNYSNLLATLACLGSLGCSLPESLAVIPQLTPPPGRMQVFGDPKRQALVVVDYAHTPDALEKALTTLRQHCTGELWCIFGCGGERDRSKRPLMGAIAERYADQIILTNDNPRTEPPLAIIHEIQAGLSARHQTLIELDRRRAIAHSLAATKPGDLILIAGKGHENYQEIGQERLPYSDLLTVNLLMQDI